MSGLLEELGNKLYDGDAPGVAALTRRALEDGTLALVVLNQGLLPGMDRVGRDFRDGEIFIPEVIVAARAMHAGLELIKPLLAQSSAASARKIVLGTVQGDLHDIGKKLVGIMMQGAGFHVVDLGHDVTPERFLEAARRENPDIIGMSALLSTTMPVMKTTIEVLRHAGLDGKLRIMVGGAPVTRAWADEIGADGYAADAVTAVECARRLMQAR